MSAPQHHFDDCPGGPCDCRTRGLRLLAGLDLTPCDCQHVWTWDAAKQRPWPLFVRVNGLKNGEPGLKEAEGNEVLEWEPGREPSAAAVPNLIIAAPPAQRPGFFDRPANIKVS